MFNPAFTLVRGASRIQARSLLQPSTCTARDVIASAARGRHGKRSHGSQQSNRSSGQGPRHNGRLPVKSTAVAGFSVLAALANLDNRGQSKPNCAFKDPSGWDYQETDPSLLQDFVTRYSHALETNSIEEARSAHFDFTRNILQFCVHGEIIEEGPVPSDVLFGAGWYVAKEDIKIFWMPPPVQDRGPVLCVSVHHDLSDEWRRLAFVQMAIRRTELGANCLKKFNDGDTHVHLYFHSPTRFFGIGFPRDEMLKALERNASLAIQE